MLRKELLSYFVTSTGVDASQFKWGFQMKILNSLLTQYSMEEVKFAIDYYVKQGTQMYSLGWLKYGNNMEKPVSLLHAEQSIRKEGSGERNRKRIELNHKTKRRTDAPEYLFTGTE